MSWDRERGEIIRDALGIGTAAGAYALSFGALSTAAGLSLAQTCVLSLLMFTGASQFALIGVLGTGGGAALASVVPAILLGGRNALYGLHLSALLPRRGLGRAVAAQLVIDETTAMAVAREHPRAARLAFWSTGLALYVLWNAGTLLGALGAGSLRDPGVYGLDAAVPAAFVALLAPRLRRREPWAVGVTAALLALVVSPFVPAGIPILVAAVAAVAVGLRPSVDSSARSTVQGPAR